MSDILEELLAQEAELQFDRFDEETAWDLGSRMVAEAKARGYPIVIDIRRGARRIFHAARPGSSADNGFWIDRKVRTVERFGHSSYYIGRLLASRGLKVEQKFYISEMEFCVHGGCFPVIVKGSGMVGTASVSGLTEEEDHKLVTDTIRAMLAKAKG